MLQRLDEMHAASDMEVLRKLPGPKCHQLTGNLKGKWSVYLEHPKRLIFEPANEPLPFLPDGSLDGAKVTVVRILGIEDYHG